MPRSVSPIAPYAAATYGRPSEGSQASSPGSSPAQREAEGVQDTLDLSPEAQKEIAQLKTADTKVRAHEAAHMGAGGGLVRGGASFQERRGSDGQMYAVAGEVSIDTSAVRGNPSATLAKARQIQAAALAPAEPSGQDRAVAAQASQMAAQAAAELAAQGRDSGRDQGGIGPKRASGSLDLMA